MKMTSVDPGLSRYIERVRAIPVLDRETEHGLAVRAAGGDLDARTKLVEANLRFVVAVALKYRRYAVRLADLIAEGNLGLMIAAEKFDPHRGTRFVTYASYWIRALVLDLVVRSSSLVGAGSGPLRSKLFFRLRRERARVGNLVQDAERQRELLAARFETSHERIEQLLGRLDARDVSLDAAPAQGSDFTLLDALESPAPSPEATLASAQAHERARSRIAKALAALDERERYVVAKRFLEQDASSLAAIGRTLGVSRERARQLEARAKQKLREQLEKEGSGDSMLDMVA